jgi:hypothetical protein
MKENVTCSILSGFENGMNAINNRHGYLSTRLPAPKTSVLWGITPWTNRNDKVVVSAAFEYIWLQTWLEKTRYTMPLVMEDVNSLLLEEGGQCRHYLLFGARRIPTKWKMCPRSSCEGGANSNVSSLTVLQFTFGIRPDYCRMDLMRRRSRQ